MFHEGQTIYCLHVDAYNPDKRIAECKVVKNQDKLQVKSTSSDSHLNFALPTDNNAPIYDVLFFSKAEAEVKLRDMFEEWKGELFQKSKIEFAKLLLERWIGEYPRPREEIKAMKEKMHLEFGVKL